MFTYKYSHESGLNLTVSYINASDAVTDVSYSDAGITYTGSGSINTSSESYSAEADELIIKNNIIIFFIINSINRAGLLIKLFLPFHHRFPYEKT